MKKFYFILVTIILMPFIVHASSGVAMHGAPKYNNESTHIDYSNPDAPKGGNLRHAHIGSFDSINPFALKGKSAQGLHLIYDRLMRRVWDEPFTLYPLIATHVDIPDDRASITIYVDIRAKFNDGSSITADDIIFTYETLKTEGRPNMRRIYKLVSSAQKIDTHTLKFTFGEGYDQETAMIMAMMPVLSKNYWKDRKFDASTLEPPVSSGPYHIKSIDIGKQMVFEKDHEYWAKELFVNVGHHNFETITYNYFRDNSVAVESFLKGDIDVRRETDTAKWMELYNDKPNIIKKSFSHGRPVKIDSFIFNTRREPFNDINVRKALNLAFDGEWLNKNIYHGKKKRIKSFFENSELASDKSPEIWTPPSSINLRKNLREASKILLKSGWDTIDGKLINSKTKEPLSFEILLQKSEHERIALNFINHLKRLGIDAKIRRLDSAAFRDRLNSYDYDMTAYHWISSLSPGTEQYQYWSCEARDQDMRWNFAGICSPEIDEIVKEIPRAKTREDITSLIQNLDKKLLNQVLTIPLFYTATDNYVYQINIGHTEYTPLYGPVIESWWMTPEQVKGE